MEKCLGLNLDECYKCARMIHDDGVEEIANGTRIINPAMLNGKCLDFRPEENYSIGRVEDKL